MKIIWKNKWMPEIHDYDITKATPEDIKKIFDLLINKTVVVFKNQKTLTTDEELAFCDNFGNVPRGVGNQSRKNIFAVPGIANVSGKKDSEGKTGLFGHKETLDWHTNKPSNPMRLPVVYMYGVEGTKGSRTSFINFIKAYEDLDDSFKKEINDINIICGYKKGNYSYDPNFVEHINRDYENPLVKTNRFGITGLFFPWLQILETNCDNWESIEKKLIQHVLQEKYVYHHDWNDNDVILSEQWFGVHKRWEFEQIEDRLLHRIAFDYDKM